MSPALTPSLPLSVAGHPEPGPEALDAIWQSRAIERLPVTALLPSARNARTHSRRQIKQIADSIRRFGFTNPVLVDASGGILAGHGRVEAAKLLGLEHVPTIRLDHLGETERRAYVIADNRLAELAGWDRDLLAAEIEALIDLDFEVDLTGFASAEVDLILLDQDQASGKREVRREDLVPAPKERATTRPGDVWIMGPHRLHCADARKAASYAGLLGQEQAGLCFTDPPYNVPISGHVSGLGRVRHGEFAMASGEMSPAEFTAFLSTALGHAARSSRAGAIHFVCMDWRHMEEMLEAGRVVYSELKNLCVWNKDNGGMGSLYRSKHELVFVWRAGEGPHVNNVELGRSGRNRTNVWDYKGVNSFGAKRLSELHLHPTVKPVALVADAILDCSRRGDVVLDPFCGSGTTIIACQATGRRGYGLEIDPHYADTIVRRWQDYTGKRAVHEGTGHTFEILEEVRAGEEGSATEVEPVAAASRHEEAGE